IHRLWRFSDPKIAAVPRMLLGRHPCARAAGVAEDLAGGTVWCLGAGRVITAEATSAVLGLMAGWPLDPGGHAGMTLVFIEKNQLFQDGWSAADCPRCGGVQPVRLEQVIRTVYFYCLPVGRDLVGRSQRCDYCEHAIASPLSIYQLNVDEW